MKKILILVGLLLFAGLASAYVIEGNSVFMEDEQASLRVTPHTAVSPVGKFEQTFELCNKTGTDTTIYAGYIFSQALAAGSVEYWREPVYNWVSNTKTCDYDFNYVMGEDIDRNPNRAWCFYATDINGFNENVIVWEHEFKTGNPSIKTIYYDSNELFSGNNWLDVTDSFTEHKTLIGSRHIYPFTDGLNMPANSCKTWKINYQPSNLDLSKKWDLWLWVDSEGWNCILTDTCQKTLKLDPWWNDSWGYKRPVYLPDIGINMGVTIYLKNLDFTDANFSGIALANLNDLRVVDENNNVELDRICDGTTASADGNCFFRLPNALTAGTGDNISTYYLYYGNAEATAPPTGDVDRASVCGAEDGYPPCYTGDYDFTKASNFSRYGDYSLGLKTANELIPITSLGNAANDFNYNTWVLAADSTYMLWGIRDDVDTVCHFRFSTEREWLGTVGDYSLAADADSWVFLSMHYVDGSNTCSTAIYDENMNLLSSLSGASSHTGTITGLLMYTLSSSNTGYYDNSYFAPATTGGFGTEELPFTNTAPDLNIWQIDGHDLNAAMPSFTYWSDENLTVTFRAVDLDGDDLNFNMWYGTSANAKTNKIVGDVNLSTTTAACDTNDKAGMVCSWDWNIFEMADNNYFITTEINDGTDTNTATTERSFYVFTDSTAPAIGTVIFDGFIFSETGSFIDGSGYFFAQASDAYGVVSCEYTLNGSSWVSGTYDGTYCTSDTVIIINLTEYIFNIRASDAANNTGTGAWDNNYTGKGVLVNPKAIEDSELINMGWVTTNKALIGIGFAAVTILLMILAVILLRTIFH